MQPIVATIINYFGTLYELSSLQKILRFFSGNLITGFVLERLHDTFPSRVCQQHCLALSPFALWVSFFPPPSHFQSLTYIHPSPERLRRPNKVPHEKKNQDLNSNSDSHQLRVPFLCVILQLRFYIDIHPQWRVEYSVKPICPTVTRIKQARINN